VITGTSRRTKKCEYSGYCEHQAPGYKGDCKKCRAGNHDQCGHKDGCHKGCKE